ncbi:MAG TPA: AsnC family transcriptional regulator [Gammaproteobacteria bacterium]
MNAPIQPDTTPIMIDDIDRRIVQASQEGLPLTPQPYQQLAKQLGLDDTEVMARMQRMQQHGIIRRIGAVPNHYALGYRGNGMSVWDVADDKVEEIGRLIGRLDFVSHCYQRPRHLPDWPYNLFAMVHGHDREEVNYKVLIIASLLADDYQGHEVLFSTRILKKTGLRIGAG